MPRRLLVPLITALAAVLALPLAAGAVPADDPLVARQWGLAQVRAPQAWTTSTGAGAVVAVVDSGVDLDHPDLAGKLLPGATFVGCAEDGPCGNGDWESGGKAAGAPDAHGTHVAGIIAAATGNGTGIAGVAPDAKILPVKALGEDGGTFAEIAAGVRWSVDQGADVINLSLGALPGVQALEITGIEADAREAIRYAVGKGAVVVAAAGNEAAPLCGSPGFTNGALCVTATDRLEAKPWYANLALKADLLAVAAPGGQGLVSCREDVVSTVPLDAGGVCTDIEGTTGYDFYAGTSMAAPHVAGVAALLSAQGRSGSEVVDVLTATARTPLTGTRGVYSPAYGFGIVDAQAAVTAPLAGAYVEPQPTSSPKPCRGKRC